MSGTILITGANGTLALEFVRAILSSYPDYTILGTVRNTRVDQDPNTAKLMKIIGAHPGSKTSIQQLDLAKLSDVRRFANDISQQIAAGKLPRIAAIVCNAMTWSLESGQKFTADGLETTFQVCHLSHYLLVMKLLGSMDAATGRVVMIGSATHYPGRPNPLTRYMPEFPLKDMDQLVKPVPDVSGEEHDKGHQRYGTAKLANYTFMNDLNRRLEQDPNLSGIKVLAMDPGALPASRGQAGQKASIRRMMLVINFCMPVLKHLTTVMRTAADGARDLVAVTVGSDFKGKKGYYVGLKPEADAEISHDPKAQQALWDVCWKWSGIVAEETALKISN